MTSPAELQDKRNTAVAILNIIEFKAPTATIEEYVAELSEKSLNEIIESAAKVMAKNLPELVYQLGYDVYNESTKLRHLGVMVRTNDGRGALIQIIQDRKNSAVYNTNISRVLPFNKEVDRALIQHWINNFKEEHSKWKLLGSVATTEEVAQRATLKSGKTGAYVHSYMDTRFSNFIKDERLTAITLDSWFKALDMADSKPNNHHINVLHEVLGEMKTMSTPHQYDSWGEW